MVRISLGVIVSMTHLTNNPEVFMEEMLEGFCELYPQYVRAVSGGVVRSTESKTGKVAVVVGGGSGHYPAFCGVVGPGFADGAVVGNIFTSPSAQDAYNVGKAAEHGGGILFITGNYAGDVLNFNQAQSRLISEGYQVKNFYVTDDVASATVEEITKRRGIAGDFAIFKIASAAAEEGLSLGEVEKITLQANHFTRTLGVAFAGCTLPGASSPLFQVPIGKMGLGLGIHGEPGVSEDDMPSAHELAEILVAGALKEFQSNPIRKIAVVLNGLGATKYEELFVTWRSVSKLLLERGYEVIEPEVGELVTSLDMAGCSLTIMLLDKTLERLWKSSCDTPSYKKGEATTKSFRKQHVDINNKKEDLQLRSSQESHQLAVGVLAILKNVYSTICSAEEELGRIDAVAGDGDHGRGMVKGLRAAVDAANEVVSSNGGLSTLFIQAGDAWAAKAGGTSGVLWGNALTAAGQCLSDDNFSISAQEILDAVSSGISSIQTLGKAELGDKTMLDAMLPFVNELEIGLRNEKPVLVAWGQATKVANISALATSALSPKIGRARPLAERSVGTPDAGAVSFGMIVKAVYEYASKN
jgi:dihydroxyacetone kinase